MLDKVKEANVGEEDVPIAWGVERVTVDPEAAADISLVVPAMDSAPVKEFKEVTPPPDEAIDILPLPFVIVIPDPAVIAAKEYPEVKELPISSWPLVGVEVLPVPPWETDRAVVKPVSEVISELAPEAAAPKAVLAPDAVAAPVPP